VTSFRKLTPAGRGGVALVAIEGPDAAALMERLFRPARAHGLPAADRVATGHLLDPEGEAIDEVLLARAGPETFELGCHGGPAVVERVVAALRAAGARERAEPNDATDRTAAEAQALLPRAPTELGCRVLLAQLGGALARALESACARLDEDPAQARADLEALLATWPLGRALTAPPRVALIGAPNAGKSSLMNALLGHERVIVAPEPGTTRDAVEEVADLDGVPARLVDTAGQHAAAGDEVEAAGIARAREVARDADLRLVVVDVTTADAEGALTLARACATPRVVAFNKVDLRQVAERAPDLAPVLVSARTGEGLPALRAALRAALVGASLETSLETSLDVLVTARQRGLVEGALRALAKGDVERARTCLQAIVG
jgi:tRNA modification GTPase